MALTYVGGTSGTGTGASFTVSLNGTLTGGTNSSPSTGDLILVFIGQSNSASVTSTCSGNTSGAYTTISAHQNQADTYDANLDSYYRFAGATPDTTLTIGRVNNTTYGCAVAVQVWRGAHATTPFNVTPTVAAASNSSVANPAAITPTTTGSMIVYCGHGTQAAASGTAYTAAGTYPITVKGDGSTSDAIIMVAAYTAWTSGAYDPAAFAGSTTTTACAWAALTIVIQPTEVVNYPLTCNSGSYTYTGSSADITYVGKKPIRISTTLWRQDTLGTTGTPGAKSITVPADAQAVVVQLHSGQAGTPQNLSISSDFAGTFTIANSTTQNGCSLGYAVISSTGAKNLTLSWTQTALEGPEVYISFIKNINTSDWVREVAVVGTNASGTSASNVFDTSADDLLLVVNDQDGSTAPTTISGFTSLATTDGTYGLPSRLQSCDSPGAITTTVTGTTTSYDVLSGISIKPNTTGAYTLTANAGSYAYTGSSATISRNRVLISNSGAYSYTGSSADLTVGAALNHRALTADPGSYIYTGSTAALLRNRVLVANSGSYALTGSSATILRKRALTANGGSYIITGGTAALLRGRVLTTQAGSYSLTGGSAVLLRGRFLVASSGSYTYTGSSATITYTQAANDYPLTALSGTYTLTGSSATILRSKLLVASSGSYLLTGQQASLSVGKHLQALAGAYVISGGSIVIQKTGMVWPVPEQVLLGVQYGPTGFEYTGTLDVLGVKFDITTGQLVKPISNKVVITL